MIQVCTYCMCRSYTYNHINLMLQKHNKTMADLSTQKKKKKGTDQESNRAQVSRHELATLVVSYVN